MSTSPIDGLNGAIEAMRGVLAGLTPDKLSAQTPCASWVVADVINHVIDGTNLMATMLRGEQPGAPAGAAAGDYLAAFDAASENIRAAAVSDGAMERMITMRAGEMPGAAVLGLRTTDTLVHAWDIAKGAGQSTDIAPELAAAVLVANRVAISPVMRGDDGKAPFGPEQPAPTDASAADRLAAFLGRTVA
jgi:uncharacterized protein (TIGR03086 family)